METIVRYKSLNGYKYESVEDCKKADTQYLFENSPTEEQINKEVDACRRAGKLHTSSYFKAKNFPRALELKTKHENYYIFVSSAEKIASGYFHLLKLLSNHGMIKNTMQQKVADAIIEKSLFEASYGFIILHNYSENTDYITFEEIF